MGAAASAPRRMEVAAPQQLRLLPGQRHVRTSAQIVPTISFFLTRSRYGLISSKEKVSIVWRILFLAAKAITSARSVSLPQNEPLNGLFTGDAREEGMHAIGDEADVDIVTTNRKESGCDLHGLLGTRAINCRVDIALPRHRTSSSKRISPMDFPLILMMSSCPVFLGK